MGNLNLWGCLGIILIPGFVLAKQNIKIHTTIHARYAVTEVKAEFITGNSSEYVGFETELIPEAIISDFSVTADGYVCDDNLAQIINERNYGINGRNSKLETTGIRIKENTQGYFNLKFEHPVLKNVIDNNFNIKIPVQTSQFYNHWSVMIDIIEDHIISTIKPTMEMYSNWKNISDNFTHNKKNVQSGKLSNKEIILFNGTLTTPDNSNITNIYAGYFSVDYTTNQGKKQLEIYLSPIQIGAFISQNPLLDTTLNTDIVVLIDVSGSMKGDKLNNSKKAITKVFLNNYRGLTEQDQVTFITFNSRIEDLGTFNGTEIGKEMARETVNGINAIGSTDINTALLYALDVTEDHIGRGSTDIPLIAIFTDGEQTSGEKNTTKIIQNIKDKNLRCIPIDSFAIGDPEKYEFLGDISKNNCGKLTTVDDSSTLENDLKIFFRQVKVPVYSSNPKFHVKSDCVDKDGILSDITALSGKKFANTDIELINIPFRTNIDPSKPCEVDIQYTSIVANKPILEELKICYHQGKRVYEKFTDLSLDCSQSINSPNDVHEKGYFIDNLRTYRKESNRAVGYSNMWLEFVTCKEVK